VDALRPDKAAEYRQQAEKIRAIEAGISLLEAKVHLLEAARHLEELAADEERREDAPELLARAKKLAA
jgi:hypothetical protein